MVDYYNDLALAIVTRAVYDYKILLFLGVDRYTFKDKEKAITKKELEKFFRSKWCDFLLQNMDFTGLDILTRLNRDA